MKRFATSIILAGGLFAGLLGATGAAHATSSTDFGGTIGLGATDDSLPLGMGDTSISGAGTSVPIVIAGGGISFG